MEPNEPEVLSHLTAHLVDERLCQKLPSVDSYTKVLGLKSNAKLDAFQLTDQHLNLDQLATKRMLASDIVQIFISLDGFHPRPLSLRYYYSSYGW